MSPVGAGPHPIKNIACQFIGLHNKKATKPLKAMSAYTFHESWLASRVELTLSKAVLTKAKSVPIFEA
jgi:hypothetical protein